MTHRILHIIAVLFTALALTLIISHGRGRASMYGDYTDVVYSELLQDFIVSTYELEGDKENLQIHRVYRNTRGEEIEASLIDSLCPLNNASQLAFESRFPTTVCGVAVTAREASDAVYQHRIVGEGLDYGLYDLIDAHSYLSQQFATKDLMRFTDKGVEFILPETNRVDEEKTALFNTALHEAGFCPEETGVWNPISRTDIERYGFFVTDANGSLFRLSMVEGKPVVEKLPQPADKQIKHISFVDRADYLAFVVTTDGACYVLSREGYDYRQLPLPSLGGYSVELQANLLYNTFVLTTSDNVLYIVLDKDWNPVAQYERERKFMRHVDLKPYYMPVFIYDTTHGGVSIDFSPIGKFMVLNLILAAITFYIRRRNGYVPAVQIIDTLIVAVWGLVGMIAALAIPYRRVDKQLLK
ncbi:MAG: DUF4857 domain-containing protein [Coprobacter sp.]|nr:DUF4857 domain-containing protein [Coprobacter sp.]